MPSNGPASQRAQLWTSETMLLAGLALSTTSKMPATMINTTMLTTNRTTRASKPAPLPERSHAATFSPTLPARHSDGPTIRIDFRSRACWSRSEHERNLLLVFHPFRAKPGGSRTPKGMHAGGGQSNRLVAATAKAQRQRRLVGLVSDRPTATRLACADHCNPRPDSAVNKQAVKGPEQPHRAARDARKLLEAMG